MERIPCVYILASKHDGTLYIGVTSQLAQLVYQHKHDIVDGFTKKYRVHMRVWYEVDETIDSAISREKELKKWRRKWKIELIEQNSREWFDLYNSLF